MMLIRNPYINAIVVSAISLMYAIIFILTSNHLEFERMLNHGQALNSVFWNGWSAFLRQGNLKYVGYIYIAIIIFIIILSVLRKKSYDEYQVGILTTSFVATGFLLLLLFPVALLLVLSDPNYAIEAVLLLIVAHWSVFLIADLVYVVKWIK